MRVVSAIVKTFAANESGSTAIEYGLIVSLIFLVILASMQQVGAMTGLLYAIVAAMLSG